MIISKQGVSDMMGGGVQIFFFFGQFVLSAFIINLILENILPVRNKLKLPIIRLNRIVQEQYKAV